MSGLMARILPADSHSPPTAARSSHIFSYLDTIIFKSLCWESVSVEKSPRALRIAHFIISTPNESSVLQSSPRCCGNGGRAFSCSHISATSTASTRSSRARCATGTRSDFRRETCLRRCSSCSFSACPARRFSGCSGKFSARSPCCCARSPSTSAFRFTARRCRRMARANNKEDQA